MNYWCINSIKDEINKRIGKRTKAWDIVTTRSLGNEERTDRLQSCKVAARGIWCPERQVKNEFQ